jgi:hypothetical protein
MGSFPVTYYPSIFLLSSIYEQQSLLVLLYNLPSDTMITAIGHIIVNGLPIALYFGIATFISLLITATIGFLYYKGKYDIPITLHMGMACLTIILAFIHVTLVIWQFFF